MEVLAVCHVHSTWSYDGRWSLEALSAKFAKRGCQVLMMTEHDRGFTERRLADYREACAQASSDKILVIPGIEYSDAANRVHVLVWGRIPFLGEGLPTNEMLDRARSTGGVPVLAHPSRRDAWRSFDPHWTERLLGIEAWNRKYDGWAPSRTAPSLLDMVSAVPFVGLDFHTERQSFPLTMALDLDGSVTEEAVLNCLKSRRCSARAFGLPLNQGPLRTALPALNVAERSRRIAASIARRTRVSANQQTPVKEQ